MLLPQDTRYAGFLAEGFVFAYVLPSHLVKKINMYFIFYVKSSLLVTTSADVSAANDSFIHRQTASGIIDGFFGLLFRN